mmetsp:Transcript_40132/g.46962  ORF Transcript_40132/g.46962 Transcript_40132/m.46962 type:complete len:98 (+) Transcript_40132:1-294(+)
MPSSCGKRGSEELDLEKIKTDNKIRVAVNLHNHVNSTCESSSSIRHLVMDLKSLKKRVNTAKLINEIDRCAQKNSEKKRVRRQHHQGIVVGCHILQH